MGTINEKEKRKNQEIKENKNILKYKKMIENKNELE